MPKEIEQRYGAVRCCARRAAATITLAALLLWVTAMLWTAVASAETTDAALDLGDRNAARYQDAAPAHPLEPTQPPAEPDSAVSAPWLVLEAGHDKCKKRRPWRPLPGWCGGHSSWPVRKVEAVTAKAHGIQDAGALRRRVTSARSSTPPPRMPVSGADRTSR
jgi:hypothetical protein